MRLAVLGGSSPFTVCLFDELAVRVAGPGRLALHGRDHASLVDAAGYARHVLGPLGWQVSTAVEVGAAVEGADVVVHQVRYGGLAGRAEDERLAALVGAPPDETLGPGGLFAALRASRGVRRLAIDLLSYSPGALVLNLTNPLSVTTTLLHEAGVRVWGLCELPVDTHRAVALCTGLDTVDLAWSYTGLNHRGFLHHLECEGRDLLPDLAALLPDRSLLGVLGAEVLALQALPTKYFGLLTGHAPHGSGRAALVARIRAHAAGELHSNPQRRPPSLIERPSPWYAVSVAPVLAALTGDEPLRTVVNLPDEDGLVRERTVVIRSGCCEVLRSAEPPIAAAAWLRRFEAHERAVLRAVREPSRETLRAAGAADPLLTEAQAEAVADVLSDRLSVI